MKKQLPIIVIAVFLAASCTTGVNTIFDDSVPLERSAWIAPFRTGGWSVGTVTGYNGIPVEWTTKGPKQLIQIPAGDTELEWDLDARTGNSIYRGKNLIMRFNFQPEKQYFFFFKMTDEQPGLNVYAYDLDEKVGNIKEEKLVGWAPFLNVADKNAPGPVLK